MGVFETMITLNCLMQVLPGSSVLVGAFESMITLNWASLMILPLPILARTSIRLIVRFYILLVMIWAVLSWFDHSKGFLRDLYTVLDSLVGPYVNLFKKFIPPIGNVDFSPIVAVILLEVLLRLLV